MYLQILLALLFQVTLGKHLSVSELENLYGVKVSTKPHKLLTPLDASQTLRQAAEKIGLYIGAAVNVECLTNSSDKQYAQIAGSEMNLFTAENECKVGETEPQMNQFTFTQCEFIANFASQSKGVMRNHNQVWGSYNPQWLDNSPPSSLPEILTSHVSTVIQTFNGSNAQAPSSYCFDVVNEAVSDSGSETFKNVQPWYPALTTYVHDAFVAARAANPLAKLFYNDYGGEGMNQKSDKIYAVAQDLVSKGLLDGVGLQMHISVDSYPSKADVSANMQRLVALGLEVHITEMDVRCTPVNNVICNATRLDIQAQIYGDLLQACIDNMKPTNKNGKGGCKSFEFWGFTDRYTWLWSFENPNHLDVQPLPWDFDYNIKSAYTQMLSVLQAAASSN